MKTKTKLDMETPEEVQEMEKAIDPATKAYIDYNLKLVMAAMLFQFMACGLMIAVIPVEGTKILVLAAAIVLLEIIRRIIAHNDANKKQ